MRSTWRVREHCYTLTCHGHSLKSAPSHWLQAWPLFSSEPTSQHASFHSPKQHPTGWSPPQCQSISCGAERQHEAHASALGPPSQAAEQGVPRTAGTFPKAWCALGFVALAVGKYLNIASFLAAGRYFSWVLRRSRNSGSCPADVGVSAPKPTVGAMVGAETGWLKGNFKVHSQLQKS